MLVSITRAQRIPTLKEQVRDLKLESATLGLLNKRNGVDREVTLQPGEATRIGHVGLQGRLVHLVVAPGGGAQPRLGELPDVAPGAERGVAPGEDDHPDPLVGGEAHGGLPQRLPAREVEGVAALRPGQRHGGDGAGDAAVPGNKLYLLTPTATNTGPRALRIWAPLPLATRRIVGPPVSRSESSAP